MLGQSTINERAQIFIEALDLGLSTLPTTTTEPPNTQSPTTRMTTKSPTTPVIISKSIAISDPVTTKLPPVTTHQKYFQIVLIVLYITMLQ